MQCHRIRQARSKAIVFGHGRQGARRPIGSIATDEHSSARHVSLRWEGQIHGYMSIPRYLLHRVHPPQSHIEAHTFLHRTIYVLIHDGSRHVRRSHRWRRDSRSDPCCPPVRRPQSARCRARVRRGPQLKPARPDARDVALAAKRASGLGFQVFIPGNLNSRLFKAPISDTSPFSRQAGPSLSP